MLLRDILNRASLLLQEDPESREFWSTQVLSIYASEGYNHILSETNILLKERDLALARPTTGSASPRFVGIPLADILNIRKVFWVDDTGKYTEVKITTPRVLDTIDPNWRTANGTPTHCCVWGADNNVFQQGLLNGKKLTLQLYPSPESYDPLLSGSTDGEREAIEDLVQSSNGEDSLMYEGSDAVRNYQEDGVDVWAVEGQPYGTIRDFLGTTAGTGNYCVVRYTPKPGIASHAGLDTSMDLPFDLEMALIYFVVYKAYTMEGEASDLKRAEINRLLYQDYLSKWQIENGVLSSVELPFNPDFEGRQIWVQ